MKKNNKHVPTFRRTSISLPPEIYRIGSARAAKASRTFSNYVSILIQSDRIAELVSK